VARWRCAGRRTGAPITPSARLRGLSEVPASARAPVTRPRGAMGFVSATLGSGRQPTHPSRPATCDFRNLDGQKGSVAQLDCSQGGAWRPSTSSRESNLHQSHHRSAVATLFDVGSLASTGAASWRPFTTARFVGLQRSITPSSWESQAANFAPPGDESSLPYADRGHASAAARRGAWRP
jgi:hypothetical protein